MKKYILLALQIITLTSINNHSNASNHISEDANDKQNTRTHATNVTTATEPQQNTCRFAYVPRERVFVDYKDDLPMFREKSPKDTTFMERFWKVVNTYRSSENSQ